MTEPFRVLFVAGVTPDKWSRIWKQRMPQDPLELAPAGPDPVNEVRTGAAALCFVRLPIDRAGLHVIPLYEEIPVVVVSKDHPVAAIEQVEIDDLADEPLLQRSGTVPEWREVAGPALAARADALAPMSDKVAIALAAAGSGIVIVPLSVARLHHRKDVVHRPVTGVAHTRVGLAWRVNDDDERIETFIGIVRGRTERSTRGAPTATTSPNAPPPVKGLASRATRPGAARGSRGGQRRAANQQQRRKRR